MIIKSRCVGKSVILTIPKDFDIQENQEYKLTIENNGTLIFEPVQKHKEKSIHSFMDQFYPLMQKLKDK